ncbi:secondary thiamine-phosphate synthase enzyme YjbQ [Xanthobacter autotrophicus]|uniref:secondary thiamine-phosphate synthase enzyme YjbQ n=1 Tax=Xanthobacter autotrophicus TaxID=280 RepID=UPI0024A6958E|nr:secondary thiamine-phosphate synthase enzyme YjbQ [Xanthobacter autotrophicus]MDI4655935.1 secondary thiamine-phosphate synthase enzyme YjbQ [Xanthobacter autotrophicus]
MARTTRSAPTLSDAVRHAEARLKVETPGEGFTEITAEAAAFLGDIGAGAGVLTVFCRHTSASLTIQENADPDVRTDLLSALDSLAPRDFGWVHDTEGPDDMPAHVRTLLSDTSLSIPVSQGRMALGTWQGLYLIEHRDRPQRREVVLAFTGTIGHMA